MCDFCHKHGEGKRWYLQAKNYSEDLLSDLKRRDFIREFFAHTEHLASGEVRLGDFDRLPRFVRAALIPYFTRRQQKSHFGQVVPIEDVEQIFGFATSIVRLACICREVTLGREARYCYGVSLAPKGGEMAEMLRELHADYLTGPDTRGLEVMTSEEALKLHRHHEEEGLCHTVWTFITPFIGGICNCDRTDCLALRTTLSHGLPTMFRAEYVAKVDPEACRGCRECMRGCQFGAISFSAAARKAIIDLRRCYGCGVCRRNCPENAISLEERTSVPAVAKVW